MYKQLVTLSRLYVAHYAELHNIERHIKELVRECPDMSEKQKQVIRKMCRLMEDKGCASQIDAKIIRGIIEK